MLLFSSAWQFCAMTRCQWNLHAIYQAQNIYRAENGTTAYATGGSWPGKLLPYLEGQSCTFLCPAGHGGLSAGAGSGLPGDGGDWAVVSSNYGLSRGSYQRRDGTPVPIPSPGLFLILDYPKSLADYGGTLDGPVQITFDVYSSATFQTFLYTITLDSPMVRATQVGPSSWQYDIDDQPSCLDFGDIICIVDYEGDVAQRITFLPPIYHVCRFNLCVNGEVLVHDIDQHIGKAFTLTPLGDEPYWDKYFILDPDDWMRRYGDEGGDWQSYQALRHFGKANVLFCDGHIELLSPEELRPTCPSWRYPGGNAFASEPLSGASLPLGIANLPLPIATNGGLMPMPIGTKVSRPTPVPQPVPKGQGQGTSVTTTAQVTKIEAVPAVVAAYPSATAVTFHWNCADAADVYLNGAPLRKLPLDFRVRPAEGRTEFSAEAVIRRGDVITIGARRGEACGFLLVAVDRNNKVVWQSDSTNWRAYFPGEKPWYVPAVAKTCRSEAVSVQKPAPPLHEAMNRRFGGAAASIWHGMSQYIFLVSVIR
jgi:prepilin-type processing-associated H-X9-DG protein